MDSCNTFNNIKEQPNAEEHYLLKYIRAFFAWDSVLLGLICTADMLSTLYWVNLKIATEANPYMNQWLQHGPVAFCTAKILSFLPLLLFTAYYRPTRPKLIKITLRGSIVLYLTIYAIAVGSQFINHW